ncbi:hypothetical protein FOCC_FOCC008688, partial [Frankliniella occidentalis]
GSPAVHTAVSVLEERRASSAADDLEEHHDDVESRVAGADTTGGPGVTVMADKPDPGEQLDPLGGDAPASAPATSGRGRPDGGEVSGDGLENSEGVEVITEVEPRGKPRRTDGSGECVDVAIDDLIDEEYVVIKITSGPGPGSNAQQQHWLPPGYHQGPPQHYSPVTPPLQPGVPTGVPGVLSHGPPPNQSGLGFHKDERTQRQHIRLKRKLEQKQTMKGDSMTQPGLGGSTAHGTPPASPRKDLANGLRTRVITGKERGMSSVGTSEDGEESSSLQDEEDDVELITEMLSSVQPPQVAELDSTSALLHWSSPEGLMELGSDEILETDLRYEVLLSDKGKEGRYKSIYNGLSHSCRIQDLQPGKEYSVCLLVHLDELRGQASEPTTFTTPACRPEAPQPPRLIQKNRFGLQLRWQAAVDNGAHIQQYILECDNGTGVFSEAFRTRAKQHNLSRLQPGTAYRFRLAAVNECGRSNYSEIVTYVTAGNVPSPPNPPILRSAAVTGLHLAWTRRQGDEEFVLQMDDRYSNYGYMPVYTGRDTHHLCDGLRRHSEYRFRLKANNEDGSSRWSEEVCYRTLPDRPCPPSRPIVKGKIHAHSFKVKWDAPHEKGGADISSYTLELGTDKGNFHQVYQGIHSEHMCERLTPGTQYILRVCCVTAGGRSDFSDVTTVTTDAVCPGQCQSFRLHGKPRATSLSLKWSYPNTDGGAPLSQFEIEVANAEKEKERRQAYVGRETECTVQDLQPGKCYVFHLRACNRVGPGPWSEPLKVQSGSAPPEIPLPPQVNVSPRSPPSNAGSNISVLVAWTESASNGSPITEYQLQVGNLRPTSPSPARSTSPSTRPVSPASSVSSNSTTTPNIPASPVRPPRPAVPAPLDAVEILDSVSPIERRNAYVGSSTSTEVKNLLPATTYHFRVQAGNSAGWSGWSADSVLTTPPGPPAAPTSVRGASTPYSVTLTWSAPICNGSPILSYQIDLPDRIISTDGPDTQIVIDQLKPQSQYRIRVRAVNAVGTGPYSQSYKCTTKPLPPSPPNVECVTVGHNHLKLKWGDGRNPDFTQYILEMENPRSNVDQFQTVYQGTNHTYKVNRLQELTVYRFRIAASSDAGQGDFSEIYEFSTCIAPPSSVKAPKAIEIQQRSCVVEWLPCRPLPNDPVVYQLQLSRLRDQDYKVVYRGSDTKTTLEDLEPGAEYDIRVTPIRCTSNGDLCGASSPASSFSLPAVDLPEPVVRAVPQQAMQPTPMTDKQKAAIILSMFGVFAVVLAVILHSVLG